MANNSKLLNEIVSYGLQNKKKKDEIMRALLKSGQVEVGSAANAIKALDDMKMFSYETENTQPGKDPKQKYDEALKFALDNRNSDDINMKTRANKFLLDVESKKILPNGYRVENDEVAAIIANPQIYNDLTPSIKSELIPELSKAGFKFPKKLSGEQEKARNNAETGIAALSDMNREVFDDGGELRRGNLVQEAMPLAFGAKNLRTQANLVKEAISRMQSGAALTDTELKFYRDLIPGPTDSTASAKYKMDQLSIFFAGMSGAEIKLKNDEGKIIKYDDMFDPRQRGEVRKMMSAGFKVFQGTEFDQVYGETVVEGDPANEENEKKEDPGVMGAVGQGFRNIGESIRKSGEGVSDILDKDISNPAKVVGVFGQFLKPFTQIGTEAIATPLRAAGEVVENVTGYDINMAVKTKLEEAVKVGMDTDEAKKAMEWWNNLNETNPEAATVVGGLLNAVDFATVGFAGGKAAVVEAKGVAKGGEAIFEKALKTGGSATKIPRAMKEKVSDIITPIEPGVKNFLGKAEEAAIESKGVIVGSETKLDRLNKYVKQAEEAVNDFSKPTPLELAGEKAEKTVQVINEQMKAIGTAKNKITERLSDIKVGTIANDARAELKSLLEDRLGTMITKKGIKNAAGRVSSLSDKADTQLLKTVDEKLRTLGANPTFRKVDDTIDYIQDLIYKRSSNVAIPVNGKVEGIVKNTIGKLNNHLKEFKTGDSAIDNLIGGYKNANDKFSKVIGTRDELNKLLGEKGKRAGALMKRVFSPSDAGTKKLFAKVKDITGINLVDEATLAKFVMENVGDARQASLLEEAIKGNITSSRSFIANAANKVIGKMQDPIGKARRIIQKGKK